MAKSQDQKNHQGQQKRQSKEERNQGEQEWSQQDQTEQKDPLEDTSPEKTRRQSQTASTASVPGSGERTSAASDSAESKEQELAARELALTRREIEVAQEEAEVARREADQAKKETARVQEEEAHAKEDTQKATREKSQLQEELGRIRREVEAAEARKQAVQAEIEAAEKRAEAAQAEMKARQAEAEKQAREQEAKEKQAEEEGKKEEGEEKKPPPEEEKPPKEEEKPAEKEKKPPEEEKAQPPREERPEEEKGPEEEEGEAKKKIPFKDTSPEETLRQLRTNPDQGLTQDEAQKRLEQSGPNELAEERVNPIWKFLSYFWGPIPWMIEVAAVLSAILQHWIDLAIIGGLLLFNAVVGFWQEHQASNALDALRKQLAPKARVRRDSQWREIEARELVPGDILRLQLGDVVPADAKLIRGDYLSVDQSALTGESLPVDKKAGDLAYSGSGVKQGEMVGVVTTTGGKTFFGRTAELVAGAGAKSHFQHAVMRVGDFLILIAVVLSIILIVVELFRGLPVLSLVQFVLILVVASVPVAMPAVLSVTMALGALALSRQKAIVSRLQSIEEAAGVDILCSDKTGTLTQNKLTLGDPVLFEAKDAQEVILAGALASKKENQDAIDKAVVTALKDAKILDQYQQKKFVPFDPVKKKAEATVADEQGNTFRVTKGAPQVIIGMSALKEDDRKRAEQTVNDLAAEGNRTLGVARDGEKGQWHFLGILPMSDPPREDSAETIQQAREHGITIKMVTGDNVAIAREIAGQLGLGRDIHPAEELFPEGADVSHVSAKAEQQMEQAGGFAQVFPEHKYGIVKALQGKGHIVGMTGDGVNDAPALKQADMGIAVSGATDAARSAASLILTQPGLSVIINAVNEARRIFERMMSYTIYRITMTLDIMIFVVLAMLVFNVFPLSTIMIILLALLDDIPIMTIAYDNTRLDPKPVRWDLHRTLFISSVLGFFAIIETFGLLLITLLWLALDLSLVRTAVWLQLIAGGHLMLFLTRTRRLFWRRPYPAWTLLGAIFGTQVLAVFLAGFGWLVPAIGWWLVGLIWAYNIVWMFVLDLIKAVAYRLMANEAKHQRDYLEKTNKPLHPHSTR